MIKKLILLTNIIVVCGLLTGCDYTETDVANDPKYNSEMGKEYRTKDDFVLYYDKDNKQRIELSRAGDQSIPPKNKMSDKFPFKYFNSTIVGILPAGSVFKVTKAILRDVPHSFSYIYYMAVVKETSSPKFLNWEIDPMWLTDNTIIPPKFDEKYVEEIHPQNP
ncbi:MAG: hypothetical protein LHV69_11895 [Elusimicrobia bacterium]|nr:hypothetical protein [Candidatus Obscuribacterium magneticum]